LTSNPGSCDAIVGTPGSEGQGDALDTPSPFSVPALMADFVPRFSPEARKAHMALVDVVKGVAGRKGAMPAQ